MKPETSPNGANFESPSVNRVSGAESINRGALENSNEISKFNAERQSAVVENSLQTQGFDLAATLPTPVNFNQTTSDKTVLTSNDAGPDVANDDDLIEKEWVDKAKKIISETKSDPHAQEERVSKLQVDYVKKRYGRDLGAED